MDKGKIAEILKELVSIDGPSGAEAAVNARVGELARPWVDAIETDALGNAYLIKRGSGPEPRKKVMIAAHMDEIGLMVTRVEEGFLHFTSVGGVDSRGLVGQEVTVYPTGPDCEKWPEGLPGYIGMRPPHLLPAGGARQPVSMPDLRIDLGRAPGFFTQGIVQVGDLAIVVGPYIDLLGGRVASKGLDNRASVAAMLGSLGYLTGVRHEWDVIAVATTQEEIGLKGATTAAYRSAPDVALVLDVTFGAQPGVDESKTVEMDSGPAIGVGPNLHPGVVRRLRAAAEALELDTVTEPLPANSGTDAWALQVARAGIPTGLLSIPIRYMHSPTEVVALADLDRTARLTAAWIAGLDDAFLAGLPEEV